MTFNFQGKKVLITGGCGGLGSGLVKAFHESGATVFAIDIDEKGLKELEDNVPGVKTIVADVTNWDEVKKTIEGLGPLDHLVNNVGVCIPTSNMNVTEAEYDKMFNINFKAALNISQVFANAAIEHQIKDATIVNTSSVGSLICSHNGGPIYSCTKAALDMLTKCHAVFLGKHGIRVNAVNPAIMNTPLINGFSEDFKAHLAELSSRLPIKGFIPVQDVVNLVLFLSSSSSGSITGRNIPIEKGYLLC